MKYSKLKRVYGTAEGVLNRASEEETKNSHPKLTLVSSILRSDHPVPPLPKQINNHRSMESKEGVGNFRADDKEEVPSSLFIYLKTIKKIPLLTDEEEKRLGKQIKDCEKECKDLVIKWKHLFKNKFLHMFSPENKLRINSELQRIRQALSLFDNLTALEEKRKKVESRLQEHNRNTNHKEKLKENLYKITGDIAKCIAKITLTKEHLEKTIYKLGDVPSKKENVPKRRFIENDLRRILEDISRLSKEIKKLKSELIHANQKLVTAIARKYSRYGIELTDMIQEGNLGLIRAIDTFDYRRSNRFRTYAHWWIRQAIIRALQCKLRTIRKPNHLNEKFTKIVKVSNRLYQEFKREPTMEEIAEEIQISPEFIEEVVHHFHDTISMEGLIEANRENGNTHLFNQKRNPILDEAIYSSLSQTIHVALSELSTREREVVKLRFGIGGCDYHTLEEIGVKFDFTRERSRQILESAMNKIRKSEHMIQLKDFRNSS